ncbi:Ctr copper transporter family-domain-containing protein [Schizophyllum fasciatum]
MDMGGMGGSSSSNSSSMGMGSDSTSHACKISMMWNWNTIDACFISKQWHIRSKADYAGSIVGIFFLVILVEWTRRAAREYDRRIVRAYEARANSVAAGDSTGKLDIMPSRAPFRPTVVQQLIRSLFYVAQFGAGYMMMLLAMYYNGGIIFAIFAGAFIGHFVSSWDTVGNHEVIQKDCCC